jgi:hypothetical protein
MNYKQFRTQMVARGFIIRGGAESMTLYTPQGRFELNRVGQPEEILYKVYNFNDEATLDGAFTLNAFIEVSIGEMNAVDVYDWVKADWKVTFKGNSLYNIGQLVEEGEAQREDLLLFLTIADEMKYLVLMSDYIPDEIKPKLNKEISELKDEFEKMLKK